VSNLINVFVLQSSNYKKLTQVKTSNFGLKFLPNIVAKMIILFLFREFSGFFMATRVKLRLSKKQK